MTTVAQIRNGIADNLKASIEGVHISPYPLSSPTPPFMYVTAGPVEYDRAMRRGLDEWTFSVFAAVSLHSDIGSQTLLDEFMAPTGARSVKAAVEADVTLGGLNVGAHVLMCSEQRQYTFDIVVTGGSQRSPVIGCEWTIQVLVGN